MERLVRHSLPFSCNQSDVGLLKPEDSVASDGSDSKANPAEVACQLSPFVKLLHVSLFGSPVLPPDLTEGRDLTS